MLLEEQRGRLFQQGANQLQHFLFKDGSAGSIENVELQNVVTEQTNVGSVKDLNECVPV